MNDFALINCANISLIFHGPIYVMFEAVLVEDCAWASSLGEMLSWLCGYVIVIIYFYAILFFHFLFLKFILICSCLISLSGNFSSAAPLHLHDLDFKPMNRKPTWSILPLTVRVPAYPLIKWGVLIWPFNACKGIWSRILNLGLTK